MVSNSKKRLILLGFSILVMLVLFAVNIRRASVDRLLPTPTFAGSSAGIQLAGEEETGASQTPAQALPTFTSTTTSTPRPATQTPDYAAATATADALLQGTVAAGMSNATQRARAMSNIVKVLREDEAVSVLDGYYKKIDDFSDSFNKPGYFHFSFTDFHAKHFVLRTNILWDNAGEEVSYPTAGCGLVFGYQEQINQNRAILHLDGNVRFQNIIGGDTTKPAPAYYGTLDKPAGQANLILAVDQGWISVYVNNQPVSRVKDDNLRDGWIGYAVAAGASYDFGTKCEYTDTELWIIE